MIKSAIVFSVAYSIGILIGDWILNTGFVETGTKIYFGSFSVILFAFLYSKVMRK